MNRVREKCCRKRRTEKSQVRDVREGKRIEVKVLKNNKSLELQLFIHRFGDSLFHQLKISMSKSMLLLLSLLCSPTFPQSAFLSSSLPFSSSSISCLPAMRQDLSPSSCVPHRLAPSPAPTLHHRLLSLSLHTFPIVCLARCLLL